AKPAASRRTTPIRGDLEAARRILSSSTPFQRGWCESVATRFISILHLDSKVLSCCNGQWSAHGSALGLKADGSATCHGNGHFGGAACIGWIEKDKIKLAWGKRPGVEQIQQIQVQEHQFAIVCRAHRLEH